MVYILNFVDRTIIAVVAQPIINSFNLTDSEWGLLTGPPFAIFYAFMGLPIALWADRSNRVKLIALCIVIWSIMTVLCGFAVGFLTLLLFRIGVAIGEAGCTPAATSIIGDYFVAHKRAKALATYSMGVMLGGVLANLLGGPIAQMQGADVGLWISNMGLGGLFSAVDWVNLEGWRVAFFVIGLPGVLVAFILLLTVKEPPRGHSDPSEEMTEQQAHWTDVFRELKKKPSFWWAIIGGSLVAFVSYGVMGFQAPFLMREHGLDVSEAALYFGAPLACFAAIGTFLGGYITEKLTPRIPNATALVPAVGLLIAVPFYIAAFHLDDLTSIFICWGIAVLVHFTYLSAGYTIAQGVVTAKNRATAIAVALILWSLIGNGIGPYFVGFASDFSMNYHLLNSEFSAYLTPKICKAMDSNLAAEQIAVCAEASSLGLKQAMSLSACWLILAAGCYLMASRTVRQDFVAKL
nr:MFS transporter [Paraglaciecola sp. 20A4]